MKLERIITWTVIFALVVLLLKLQFCSGRKPCPTITERIVHDTIELVGPTIEVEKPVLTKVKRPVKTDSGLIAEEPGLLFVNIDTPEVVNDYFTLKSYSQKYTFPEGTIIVENETFNNSLQNQTVFPTFKRIETTKTVKVTDTAYRPLRKTVLFIGGGLYGDRTSPLTGGIIGLTLKTKNDLLFGAGRIQGFSGQGYYYFKTDFPIHLKK